MNNMNKLPREPRPMRQTKPLLCCLLLATTALQALPAAAQNTTPPTVKTAGAPTKSAQSSASVEHDFERLAQEIIAETSDVIAVAKAHELEQLRSFLPASFYAQRTAELAKSTRSPLAAFIIYRHAARARLEIGDLSDGPRGETGPIAKQGCLTSWTLAGPFENASMQGFHAQLPPETGATGPYDGKMTAIDWRSIDGLDQFCQFNLDQAVQPATAAVTFVATQLKSPKAQKATLLIGTPGAYRVWLNGKLIGERSEERGLGIDNDAWNISLNKGENDLLIKMGSSGQGSLGLIARIVDSTSLKPLQNITQSATWNPRTVTSADEKNSAKITRNSAGLLEKIRAASSTKNQNLQQKAAWLWKIQQPGDTSTPWQDVAERLLPHANENQTLDARDIAQTAELFADHWRRLDLLTHAYNLSPKDPSIGIQLAREYGRGLSQSQEFARRDLLETIVENHPNYLPARLELADWYARNSFATHSLTLLNTYDAPNNTTKKLQIPAYARRLADWTELAGDKTSAQQMRDQIKKSTWYTGMYTWREVRELAATGKIEEALKVVVERRQLFPWSVPMALQEVALLRAAERQDDALKELDRVITLAPGNARLLEVRAQLLHATGDIEGAILSVEQALVLRPQDENLHEFLAFLRPEADRFYEPWMVQNVRALAEKNRPGAFNYDTLVDQTIVRVAPNGLSQSAVQRVDRVLTPEGVDTARAHRIAYQDGDERAEVIRVRVYKANGSVSEDFDQWGGGSSRKQSTTYNDTAYLNVRANNVEPGDLVEFQYVVHQIANENFRGDYFGDVAYIQGSRPIAYLRYAVMYPKNWELHFREPALPHTRTDDKFPTNKSAENQTEDPSKKYRVTAFELHNIDRVKSDADQPGYTEVYDHILVSNKKTYDEIGRWWWNLVEEQLVVNDEIRQTVKTLTSSLKTDEEKVRAIYNHVAKNTRYLHVGLGIHGWKPYRTSDIMRNRYGDCKDKAALLKVMLEEADVPADLVLVRTRTLGKVDEYPASMHVFNHAITYVPSLDLFLDATAEFNGSHELTSMDQDAQALIVRNGGSTRWLSLPVDKSSDNLFQQSFEVDLTGDEPVVHGHIVATGANAVYYRQTLEDPERRNEVLEKQLSAVYPGAKVISATYENLYDLDKPTEIRVQFTGGGLLQTSNDRAFLYPYGAPRDLLSNYAKQASRTQDMTLRVPFANNTTMRYRLPANRQFERVPKSTALQSRFGKLNIDYRLETNKPETTATGEILVVEIKYSFDTQRVALNDYPEFRKFVSDMTAALNETIGISQPVQ